MAGDAKIELRCRNARLDEMGDRVACGLWDHCCGISMGGMAADHVLRIELPCADHRGAAAERQGRGSGGGGRVSGLAGGLRGAGGGIGALASDHVVRDHVHGVRAGHGGACGSQRRKRRGRGIDPAAILEASDKEDACAGKQYPGSGYTTAGGAAVVHAVAATTTACTSDADSQETVSLPGIPGKRALLEFWRAATMMSHLCAVVAELADAP